jgi:hypothetical protein
VEEARGVFVSTLAEAHEADIRDHLPLVLLVAELAEDGGRLFEVLNGHRDAARVNKSESEVVERQCLGTPVTDLTRDRERGLMLLGRLFVVAFAPELRPELVESMRLAL